uniref:RNB domain-containing protein n=1 Tax=Syphacia muris TaxID=451379 RepID=A0A158R444_9BILA
MRTIYQSDEVVRNKGTKRFLSADEYALLSKIRTHSQRNIRGVRTGRVPVNEIMGLQKLYDVEAFLENWRNQNRSGKNGKNIHQINNSPLMDNFAVNDRFSSTPKYTDISGKRLPLSNFPAQLYSFAGQYTHLKSRPSFSREVLEREKNNFCEDNCVESRKQNYSYGKEDYGLPLLPRSRYGLPTNYVNSEVCGTNGLNSCTEKDSPNFTSMRRSSQLLKNAEKKLYFSEHISAEAAARGIAKKQLYEGTLYVNKRNFEESFLINTNSNFPEDLLIFGLHDRNRALHGDVVVVRVKDRENWLVRDALFCAWREGHLKTIADENGQPITVPPIRSLMEEEEILDSLNLPFSLDKVTLLRTAKFLFQALQLVIENSRCFGSNVSSMLRSDVLQKGAVSVASLPSSSSSASGVSQYLNGKLLLHRRYYFLRDLPDEYWGIPNICLQRTAEVVFVSEHKNSRAAVGMLKVMADGNRKWALFSPNDPRIPRMMIPAEETPLGFFDNPHDFAKYIYVARMIYWPASAQFARGKLYKSLGIAGDIVAETEGLLLANAVDTRSFPSSVLGSLPIMENEKWKIDEKEYKYRKDFRNEFVFAVNSVKDRKLENAFHIKRIDDCDGKGSPGYEVNLYFLVGVHVTDVAYFVNSGTELDQWAAFRGTSVQLVNEVHFLDMFIIYLYFLKCYGVMVAFFEINFDLCPEITLFFSGKKFTGFLWKFIKVNLQVIQMLPDILVNEICSLCVGSERLCLSVVWNFDEDGMVCNKWFGRSIICLKREVPFENIKVILEQFNNTESVERRELLESTDNLLLDESLRSLCKIARVLRKRRFENGSMQLRKTRIVFEMEEGKGAPVGVNVYYDSESDCFFDELLKFANETVAKEIQKVYGSTALLRRQCAPKTKMLNETLEKIRSGIELSGCSEKAIASYFKNYEGDAECKTTLLRVISHFLLRPMQLPEYICAGSVKHKEEYAHFSLGVPLYTHFTSPLSRYADIMVQRFVSAAAGQMPPPRLSTKEVAKIAAHCNDKEQIAENVAEASEDMFFGLYVKENGPLTERAVVVQILDAAFDVLIVKFGIIRRVNANKLRVVREPRFVEGNSPTLTLYWDTHENTNASVEQLIQLFSVVDVVISSAPDSVRFQVRFHLHIFFSRIISKVSFKGDHEATNSGR